MAEDVVSVSSSTSSPLSTSQPTTQTEQSPTDILLGIKSEREKNEATLAELKSLMNEQTKMLTRVVMGGSTVAGQEPPRPKTIDEEAQEKANAVIRKYWSK